MWTVRRDVMLEAIRVLDLVPSQSGIPSSDFFRIVPDGGWRLWITTAAGAVATVTVDGDGEWPFKKAFYLDRRLFTPFVSTFREIKNKAPYEFSKTEAGELRVRCGKPFMDFSAQPSVMGYGEAPKLKAQSKMKISDDLMDLLRCAASYSATDATPHLSCLYLTPMKGYLEILATNQKIVFRGKYKSSHSITEPLAFPIPMLNVLQAEGLKRLTWSDPFIYAQFENGLVWQSVSAEASKHFPVKEFREGFKHGSMIADGVGFRAEATRFARVVERLTTYLQYVRKEDWVLDVSGTKGAEQIFLVSRLPNAVINEHLKTVLPVGKTFKFDWPLDQLGAILRYMKDRNSIVVKHDEKQGMAYLYCGDVEMAMSTKTR